MTFEDRNRRDFLKIGSTVLAGTAVAWNASSYAAIVGANDRVRVGLVGAGDRAKSALVPAFQDHAKELNFEFVAVSDIWNRRRDEGAAYIQKQCGSPIASVRNNDELYARKDIDAVIVATADFQHAQHGIEAVQAGRDAYVEKPTAHTMPDARAFLAAVKQTGKIVQVGTQRRSTPSYQKAYEYIQSGKFGDIVMVEMTWNVNQPGRWRRPGVVPLLKEQDTDWKRYLLDRPYEPFDARKYLEFRLFWPYSSGIPDQWLVHQIDTVHWFTGYRHPRSVVANGGVYLWKDGRKNWDTMTAVFDYGPLDDPSKGFQVIYSSRMTNSAGGVKEIYYSNGGMLDMDTMRRLRRWNDRESSCGDGHEAEPVGQLFAHRPCAASGDLGQYRQRSHDFRQHAQLDGVCSLTQAAQREHRGRIQPFGGAVHEHCRHSDRAADHL
jgi:predicted dehydrogenase